MGRTPLRPAPMDLAGELAGCAVFGYPFVTGSHTQELLGEVGEVMWTGSDGEMRLRFTPEQASRMAERADGGPTQ